MSNDGNMSSRRVVLLVSALSVSARSTSVLAAIPFRNVSYCGDGSMGVIQDAKVNVSNASAFNISVTTWGAQYACVDETYAYDAETHAVTLPTMAVSNDCARPMVEYGCRILYAPKKNAFQVACEEGFVLTLAPC